MASKIENIERQDQIEAKEKKEASIDTIVSNTGDLLAEATEDGLNASVDFLAQTLKSPHLQEFAKNTDQIATNIAKEGGDPNALKYIDAVLAENWGATATEILDT